MTERDMRFAMLLAALIAAWQPSKAQAADEDTQIWLVGFVRGNLGDDVYLTIDTSYRWRDPAFGADQHTLRVTVEKGVDDNVRIGGGLSYFQTGPRTEIRPHQQFRYASGGLDLRTRFEQRFFEGADRVELRIRQRVQYTQPIVRDVKAIGAVEWFGIIQPREQAGPSGTEQLRGIIGIAYEIDENIDVAPSYMMQLTPRSLRPDAISHVPQLTFNYRF